METKHKELNKEFNNNEELVINKTTQQNNDYSLNPDEVTINPIDNFYKKITNNVPLILDEYFKDLLDANNEKIKKQPDLIKQIIDLKASIYNEHKDKKVIKREMDNSLIFVCFFLIFGIFLAPTYSKNKEIIKQFEKNKSDKLAKIEYLFDQHKKLTLQFTNQLSCHSIIGHVAKKLGLGYENNCSEELLDFYMDHDNKKGKSAVLGIASSLVFWYKNTPIINFVRKKISFFEHKTSGYKLLPTTQYVRTSFDGYRIRENTWYEYDSVEATHVEKIPSIHFYDHFILLTNFKSKLNISTNQEKYLQFENREFSNIYKINTDDFIDVDLMNFFTPKAQEDYVNWHRQFPNDKSLNFSKKGDYFELTPPDEYIARTINTSNNFNLVVENYNDDIFTVVNRVKKIISSYFEQFARNVMPAIISPAINREWYNSDNQYQLSDKNNSSQKSIKTKELNFRYILSRIDKPENLYFVNSVPVTRPWLDILNFDVDSDGFVQFDCLYKSHNSIKLVDNVAVTNDLFGEETIPVKYDRFYKIEEPKKIFFLHKEKNNHIFSISSNLEQTYYDLHNQIDNHENNPIFNNWTGKIKLWMPNPERIIKKNQDDRFPEILEKIRNNSDPRISIEANDDGYFLIVNFVRKDELMNVELNNIIQKLKKLLLELSYLND
ncbi:hypothetical protein [Mycoplasma sp. E35C]|uniref:hypothetical protein n=1 Tax=Mycoplasma sp. E35C TaxID=2801918 RepID=UPI001CA42434|nr:hypothetical protein [Mycoplasma sp. E35C]QZX49405.1 hypothetical protein JJE79_01505 [Mycoplasma sp. E35C]